MANVYAVKTGNWSDTTVWNTGALPTSADDVYSNNFTVTIDQNVTVLSIRNTSASGISAGGGFILNGGFTLNATLRAGSVNLLTYTSNLTSNINGNVNGGTANNAIFFNSASGTLNITGDIINNGAGITVSISNTGNINIVGNIYNTTANYGNCIGIGGVANITITGNIYTSGVALFASQYLIYVSVAATLTIIGNVTHTASTSATSGCIQVNAAATINITGLVSGGDFGQPAIFTNQNLYLNIVGAITAKTGGSSAAVNSTNINAINIFSGPFISSPTGILPIYVQRMHYRITSLSYYEFRDSSTNGALPPAANAPATRLVDPSTAIDAPIPANVRDGIKYALNTQTGTLKVPAAGSVALGVPVDNTTGTAVLTPAAVWDYATASITNASSIGARLKNCSTVDTTGEQLEALL